VNIAIHNETNVYGCYLEVFIDSGFKDAAGYGTDEAHAQQEQENLHRNTYTI